MIKYDLNDLKHIYIYIYVNHIYWFNTKATFTKAPFVTFSGRRGRCSKRLLIEKQEEKARGAGTVYTYKKR